MERETKDGIEKRHQGNNKSRIDHVEGTRKRLMERLIDQNKRLMERFIDQNKKKQEMEKNNRSDREKTLREN